MINNQLNSVNIKANENKVFEQLAKNSGSKTAITPKGYLVHENPIQAAASNVKALGADVVNLGKALKDGKSDDHSLGRLNDLGMKLSAVGIASYLLTRRSTPRAKMMEFIGAGVFFSMMNLWQKLFIAAPIKARFGVDINQKYVDSMGRRKDWGQDNQYRPNLRTREEKDALADRMGLPKDMEYRGEYAEEKERKITLQGKTLNMLTAGFATPIMTALICNRIEKYIDDPLNMHEIKKAGKEIENLSGVVDKKAANPLFSKKGSDIINSYAKSSEPVDKKFFAGLADAFNPVNFVEDGKLTKGIPDISGKIAQDLEAMFASTIDEKTASDDVFKLITAHTTSNGNIFTMNAVDANAKDGIVSIDIEKDTLEKAVQNVISKIKKGEIEYSGNSILEALNIDETLARNIEVVKSGADEAVVKQLKDMRMAELLDEGFDVADIEELFKNNADAKLNEMLKNAQNASSGSKTTRTITALPAELKSAEGKTGFLNGVEQSKNKFLPAFMEKVKENFAQAKKIGATVAGADDIVKIIDNSFGKQYSNITNVIFDVMKPTMEELEHLRSDADFACDYIEKALSEIAKDKEKFNKVFMGIADTPLMDEAAREKMVNSLIENVKTELDKAAKSLDPNMKTLRELTGFTTSSDYGIVGDIKKYASEALPGIDATKNRLLLALDFERKIAEGSEGIGIFSKDGWAEFMADKPHVNKTMEEFIADARRILYKSTPGDFANTHHIKGNGYYYEALNNATFNTPVSDAAKELLENKDKGLLNRLAEMKATLMAIGSKGSRLKITESNRLAVSDYINSSNIINDAIIKDEHLKSVFNAALAENDAIKYQKVGKSIKSFSYQNSSQIFNSKTWMRIFAPAALAIAGVTLLAQLFIGRDKDQHLYMKKNSGAVNGNK